jgi:prepilin-type N-terminal cleavage/methylation domain-containing protein
VTTFLGGGVELKSSPVVDLQDSESKNTHTDGITTVIKKVCAFTLAEMLIAIAVIGVVAAMTVPTLIAGMTERSNSETQANVARKITQAMDLMRVDGKLEQSYDSTDAFVDELSKYLKITTRCDASNLEKCWPSKTVTTSNGDTFEVANAKTGVNLNIKDNKTNNVGMILADGTPIIMTYNPNSSLISDSETITSSFTELPVGFGRTKEFPYTSNVTASIDFVMDTNGFRGPNSEARDGKFYDIRSFKIASFSTGCKGSIVDGVGCVYILPSSSPINTCEDTTYDDTCNSGCSVCSKNYWAGAKKACEDEGFELISLSALSSNNVKKMNLDSGFYWSNSNHGAESAVITNNRGLRYVLEKSSGSARGICVEKQ